MTKSTEPHFRRFWDAGFRDLIPIIPPGAPLSAATKIKPEARGKAPGRVNQQGLWSSFDWRSCEAGTGDLTWWGSMGASVGLKTGGITGADLDVTDPFYMDIVDGVCVQKLGDAPARVGRPPKKLRIYRTAVSMTRRRLWFKTPEGGKHLIELLGDGQQFVVAGPYAREGKPAGWDYKWDRMPKADDLIEITPEQVEAFFTEVRAALEAFGCECSFEGTGHTATDRTVIDQAALKSDIDLIAAAVAATPNNNGLFPGRTDYVRMACAIKAACADDPVRGQDIFLEWAMRWEGNDRFAGNDWDDAVSDWDRCKPPFEVGAEYLLHVARQAGWTGQAEHVFESEEAPAESRPRTWIDLMNERHFVVNEAGKVVVYSVMHDPSLDRRMLVSSSFGDIRNLYLNDLVEVGRKDGSPLLKSKGQAWLSHPGRRTYHGGVHFLPGQEAPPGVFNLWAGWGVEPKPGDWSLLRSRILENLCGGDPERFRYLLGWMANAVQRPATPGQVAVVLRGGRGVGKGKFAAWFGKLFGQHFLHVASGSAITGRFNEHLRDAVVVFADEAFYAGDKAHESILKALVTEDLLHVEGKNKTAVQVRNCVHLLMASNSDWVVPAGNDERRFFVLDAAANRQQDTTYFAAIDAQMKAGGAEAMLHELMNVDLSGFQVRKFPQTEGLIDQKLLSLDSVGRWWLDALTMGDLDTQGFNDWGDSIEVSKRDLYTAYKRHAQAMRVFRPENVSTLTKELTKFVPSLRSYRPRKGGSVGSLDDADNGDRPRVFVVPDLIECRKAFERFIGGTVEWGEAEA